jgi:putative drug exporter of the RND superfamily
MLKRLARICYRRRWRVLAVWVVFLVAVSVFGSAAGGVFRNEFSLRGSESKDASDFLEERGFDTRAGFSGQIVFASDQGVDDPAIRQAMEELFARVERTVPRVQVVSPYQPGEARQISENGAIAYAEVNLADRPDADFQSAADEIKAEAEDVNVSGCASSWAASCSSRRSSRRVKRSASCSPSSCYSSRSARSSPPVCLSSPRCLESGPASRWCRSPPTG